MKVFEQYNISDNDIEIKSEENDYWMAVRTFWFDIRDKDYEDISHKQKSWLDKIEKGLLEQ